MPPVRYPSESLTSETEVVGDLLIGRGRCALANGPEQTSKVNRLIMKTTLLLLPIAAFSFAACDTRVNVPPSESHTTVVTPQSEKKETNTTVVQPPAEKKTESTTTTVTGEGSATTKTTEKK